MTTDIDALVARSGPSAEHTAALLDEAADALTRLYSDNKVLAQTGVDLTSERDRLQREKDNLADRNNMLTNALAAANAASKEAERRIEELQGTIDYWARDERTIDELAARLAVAEKALGEIAFDAAMSTKDAIVEHARTALAGRTGEGT